jgi:hypothetical protein
MRSREYRSGRADLFGNMTIFPLLNGDSGRTTIYARQALGRGLVQITEAGSKGRARA